MKVAINKNVQDIYDLSAMQLGMLYHKILDEDSTEYVLQQTYEITGLLSLDYVEDCLELLVKKYDILQTLILYKKVTVPKQVIIQGRKVGFSVVHLKDDTPKDAQIKAIKQADIQQGFDLEKDSLLRVTAVVVSQEETMLIWTAHHIIFDGWCFSILLKDFMLLYGQLLKGCQKETLEQLVLQEKRNNLNYGEYIRWLEKRDHQAGLQYWKNVLAGYDKSADIPVLEGGTKSTEQMTPQQISLGKSLTKELKKFTREQRITPNTLFETVWGLVLQFYNHSDDVVFGKVVSGRNLELPHIESAVGMFINTIPVRVKKQPQQSVQELLKEMQQQSLESGNYDFCSLADVQQQSELGRDLFRSIIVYENFYVDEKLDLGITGLNINVDTMREQTNYPITFKVFEENGSSMIEILYNPEEYGQQEICQLLEKVELVLRQVIENPQLTLADISSVTPEQQKYILEEYNQTAKALPVNQSIIALFEERVAAHPQQTALIFEEKSWTYAQLNQRINQVAHMLKRLNIQRNERVGLFIERSAETIISMLAVLKSGGAYVPLETDFPLERMQYILEDSQPKAILTAHRSLPFEVDVPVFDIADKDFLSSYPTTNPEVANQAEDTAYCLYTSGTTGKPKGVLINHRNVLSCCLAEYPFQEIFADLPEPVIIGTTNYVFDIFVIESLLPLVTDRTVLLANKRQQEEQQSLIELIGNRKNLVLQTTPSKMKIFTMDQENLTYLQNLKTIILGGEPLSSDLYNFLVQNCQAEIYNVYGPTEATVWVTAKKMASDCITLGQPFDNAQLYIVDDHEHLCGFGIPGELCIAGDFVGQGYLNRPDLTTEKFTDNPFGTGKLYHTGDRARWLSNGELDYLERMDDQVKIRGFRIELEEIASVIRQQPEVQEALVMVQKTTEDEPNIVAYLISEEKIATDDLRNQLSQLLPHYMIPSAFMQIPTIPVNANGKLDRRGLPEIAVQQDRVYQAPRNDLEQKVTEIFEEILTIQPLGIQDNFFEVGAHSLLLTKAMNRLSRELDIRVPLREFFNYPTVAAISDYISKEITEELRAPLTKAEVKPAYPVTPAQRRMFVLHQSAPDDLSYNMPAAIKITGQLDLEKLNQVFQKIIASHENLRTSFHIEDEEIVQKISAKVQVEVVSQPMDSAETPEELFSSFMQPFDLTQAPLMRMQLIQRDLFEQYLFFDMHHIISDAATLELMIHEFIQGYNDISEGNNQLEFKDYSEWFNQKSWDKEEKFWQEELSGELPTLELPLDYSRPLKQSHQGRLLEKSLDTNQHQKIAALAKKYDTTEYMIFLTAFYILLMKYSRQNDILVGTPVSGRTHAETENIWGLFVNTIVLRGKPEKEKTIRQLLTEIRKTLLSALEHQEYPFEELVNLVDINRSQARNPLFDVMFTMQKQANYPRKIGNAETEEWKQDMKIAKFDLTLTIMEDQESWNIGFEYCSDLFKEATIEYMLEHYLAILGAMVKDMEQELQQIDVISEKERQKLLVEWNQTECSYSEEATINSVFEQVVQEQKDKPAILYHEQEISYAQLDKLTDKVACYVREQGVQRNQFVAIMTKRGPEMMIGILGIIKAGAAYVPIDPTFPKQRIDYILQDCQPRLLLTDQDFDAANTQMMAIADILQKDLPDEAVIDVNQPEDWAYCIYTSGTTGNPKGSIITHRNVMAFKETLREMWNFQEKDVVLQFANYVFDASVLEIFAAFLHGLPLCLVDKETIEDADKFNDYTQKQGVTLCLLPTQYVANFDAKNVRSLLTGGSSPEKNEIEKIIETTDYINAYGPTETTVAAAYWRADQDKEVPDNVPIGKPVTNTKLYIMEDERLCGVGMPGELCITGANVGEGYLNRPELTAKLFADNPFGQGKMYRSGDLARWLPDGNIEYLGRIDSQVKIRGYRVELGEVTSALKKHPQVKDAVVIARKDSTQMQALFAYYASDNELDEIKLRQFMREILPDYMLPAYFMQIAAVPLTASNKIDVRALPNYTEQQCFAQGQTELLQAKTAEEKHLSMILQTVLGKEKVDLLANFFELGGDSIKAIRMVSKLREAGFELSVKEIMEAVSIKELAAKMHQTQLQEVSQEEVFGESPLTPIQEFFFEQEFPRPECFNQALLLDTPTMEEEILQQALQEIVKHHDQLRSVFADRQQRILPITESSLVEVRVYDSDESEFIQKKNHQLQASMNLQEGPLLKAALYHGKQKDKLFLCCHHLVVDGVSWRIILTDLQQAYQQLQQQRNVQLPQKTISFKEWAVLLKEYAQSDKLKAEIPYWKQTLIKCQEIVAGQPDRKSAYRSQTLKISAELTEQLLQATNQAYNTEINDLLLSALALAVQEWRGSEKIAVQLEGHGRENLFENKPIDRTVGWFTSVFPIILEAKAEVGRTIVSTKEMLRRIPNRGVGFGILKYLTKADFPEATPEIAFNYLGEWEESKNSLNNFELSELSTDNQISDEHQHTNLLSINGSVHQDQLLLNFAYQEDCYSAKEILALQQAYHQSLVNIITEAQQVAEPLRTSSDYGVLDITEEEFQKLIQVHEPKEVEQVYDLTPMQQGILYHKLLDEHSTEYVLQQSFHVHSIVEKQAAADSLNLLGEKYPILRTSIAYRGHKQAKQLVLQNRLPEFNWLDLSGETATVRTEKFAQIKEADLTRGFDLEKDSLIRGTIVKFDQQDYHLILSGHHIIIDGWGFSVILGDFLTFYKELTSGKEKADLQKGIQAEKEQSLNYADYIHWLKEQDNESALKYWKNLLEGYEETAEIPALMTVQESEATVAEEVVEVSVSLYEILKQFIDQRGLTLNTVLETVWGITLQRYNRTEDVVFYKVVSGRDAPLEYLEQAAGLFINTIPVRMNSAGTNSVEEVLHNMQQQSLESTSYDYVSLAEIQKQTALGSQLAETLFVHENYPVDAKLKQFSEVLDIQAEAMREETNFDLTFVTYENYSLNLKVLYRPNKYGQNEIKLLLERYIQLLFELINHAAEPVQQLSEVCEREQNLILQEFNDTAAPYDQQQTAVSLFDAAAAKYPNNTALIFHDQKMNYRQLSKKVEGLAAKLISLGIGAEDFVAIYSTKCVEMYVAVLAILKAGAAFLPLDPDFPEERMNFILKDCQPKALLYFDQEPLFAYSGAKLSVLDEDNYLPEFKQPRIEPEQLAYTIYTSGTTGKPKGVLVEHRNLVAFAHHCQETQDIQPADRILQFGNYVFDVTIWEFAVSLLQGGALYIVDEELGRNINEFRAYVKEERINKALLTPPYYQFVQLTDMEVMLVGGSTVSQEQVLTGQQNQRFFNAYGPTEATVIASQWELDKSQPIPKRIPIGKPVKNSQIYILNDRRLCGIGISGEICIAGDNVTRGYNNRPELTAEKFAANPFGPGKIYRTGDLGRWLPDGNIEYLGRVDKQVKVRGFRIELDEIESHLRQQEKVMDAVVLLRQIEGSQEIVAFLVSEQTLDIEEVRRILSRKLPQYMLPAQILQVSRIPLNFSHKVDEGKLLEELESNLQESSTQHFEPQNVYEKITADLFSEVLQRNITDCKENFFELGGDSLRGMQLASEFSNKGYEISVKDIFQLQTVELLAEKMQHSKNKQESAAKGDASIDSKKRNGITEEELETLLISAGLQAEVYEQAFVKQDNVKREELTATQIVSAKLGILSSLGMFTVSAPWDGEKFQKIWSQILQEASSLRTGIVFEEEQGWMNVYPAVEADVPFLDISPWSSEVQQQIVKQLLAKFEVFGQKENYADKHLSSRLLCLKITEDSFTILMPISHLLFDGFSSEILQSRVKELYQEEDSLIHKVAEAQEYQEYYLQLKQGPQQFDEAELIRGLQLDTFAKAVKKYRQLREKNEFQTISLQVELPQGTTAKERMDILQQVYQAAVKHEFRDVQLPLLAIHNGRQLGENNYFRNIGEFADLLPIVVKPNRLEFFAKMNEGAQFMSRHSIVLAALLEDSQLQQKYPRVSKLLQKIDIWAKDIPMFNLLTMYDMSSVVTNEDLRERYFEADKNQYPNDLQVQTLMIQDNQLFLQGLLCRKGHSQKLLDYLQQHFGKIL